MSRRKISKDDLKKAKIIPMNKFVLFVTQAVETGSQILLPDSAKKGNDGLSMLEVLLVDEKCETVRPGDFVVVKPNVLIGKWEFLGDFYMMCQENEIACVIRRQE